MKHPSSHGYPSSATEEKLIRGGVLGKRIQLACSVIIQHGMTIQIASYEGRGGPTDILLCADRAQARIGVITNRLSAGRNDVFKIGKLSDKCAISCSGGTIHQNLYLSKLLGLPPVPGDDVDYMDLLGRGQLGDIDMCLNQAFVRTGAVLPAIARRILTHAHPKLGIVLCGRDYRGTPQIYSWTSDERFRRLRTDWNKMLLIEPDGLTKLQEERLLTAIAIGDQFSREKTAIGYCHSVMPILVSKHFHYARLSENFIIRDGVSGL